MAHDSSSLIAMVVVGLVLAFVLGTVANRLRISPLVGYLLAGVVVGPFTPGFVADQELAAQLAEIGVILLMFGVGLHFSLRDLLALIGRLDDLATETMLDGIGPAASLAGGGLRSGGAGTGRGQAERGEDLGVERVDGLGRGVLAGESQASTPAVRQTNASPSTASRPEGGACW